MSDLANYSIETDHMVLLSFKDGRRLRVPLGQLPNHLGADDLAKISRALKLRRDFIRRHMPKAALVLLTGGLLALGFAGGSRAVAWLQHRAAPASPAPAPEQERTRVVRNMQPASPSVRPTPQPAVKNTAITKQTKSSRTANAAAKNHQDGAGTSITITTPHTGPVGSVTLPVDIPTPLPTELPVTPQPAPSPLPSPSPSPTPTPIPSPTQQIPGQGQVLGDAIGPATKKP